MFCFSCCDCCTSSSAEERLPISRPNPSQPRRDLDGKVYENVPTHGDSVPVTGPAVSKRTTHGVSDPEDFLKDQKLIVKLVDIPDVDKLFSDIADTFNEQREHHLSMGESIRELQGVCRCAANSSLKSCIEKLQMDNGDCDVQLQMKGYNFSLHVKNGEDVPENLEQAQVQVEKLSKATRLILANETKLQEMIRSVLHSKSQLSESLKQRQLAYLDQVRVEANLDDNFVKVGLVQQKSRQYLEEAKSILKEVAELSGLTL
ncbi:hypothetical protein NDU88_007672 [Pleurodeles waltl]|uniref:Uncharacterized protein n=1 Tax=Pleurodeles waltl TaxID=8319 RepID=A0AAV7PMB7_PLEWA|nr:hypothetical protein NDU88_007672 [Pleurodeles waltl]